jgi:Protein of unknown function (DUF1348)
MLGDERPPLPPFSLESAIQKVRLAEDAWNSRDPERVSLAYTVDSEWRNRAEFLKGRGNRGFPPAEVEPRTRLSADQGNMGGVAKQNRRAFLL